MGRYLDNFDYLCDEIEGIFRVPNILRDAFINLIKNDEVELKKSVYAKDLKENAVKIFENISDSSISTSYKDAYRILYENGLILLISSSEMILRDIYDELFITNFDKIKMIQDMELKVSDLNFEDDKVTRDEIIELMKKKKYEDKNPSTRLYFENILAIQNQFRQLGVAIDLNKGTTDKLHLYYQIRHILIHQMGKIDKIFLDNLRPIKIDVSEYRIDERIQVDEFKYNDCKKYLRELIGSLEQNRN